MERELGKDLEQGKKRVAFLMDNCDAVEEKGYMKPFTPEELARMKENLSETDIEINDIEEEKKDAMKDFKARLEPLTTERKKTLEGLKKKAEFVTERCFKFIDQEAREVGYYNENDEYTTGRVVGRLSQHPKFSEFGINTGKGWEPNELGQFFKMNRAFFPDKTANMKLVTELKNFEATVNSKVEKQKSEKGDFKDNYSGVVMSNLPEAFTLQIPIFKGMPAETIEVEFYASVNGRDVTLQLVSPGACQLLEDLRDRIIDVQVARIRELSPEIAIIEQ